MDNHTQSNKGLDTISLGLDSKPHYRELSLHCLYSFFFFSSVSFIMIYLPLVLRQVGYQPKEIGLLLSSYNFIGLVCILLFGRLLDAFRCYRLLIIGGLLLAAIAFSRLFFVETFRWSLLFILLLAVGFLPQVSLIDSYISNRYQYLPQYYGRIRSLGSIGYIFFLGLSAVLQLFNPYDPWRLQKWVLGLFALIVILFVCSSIDSLQHIRHSRPVTPAPATVNNKPTGIQQLGWPLIIVLLLLVICWALIMGTHSNFLALFLQEELEVKNVSLFFIMATCSEIPVIFHGGRILYRKPLGWMLLIAFSAALLRLLFYILLPYGVLVFFAQLLHSMAYGLFHISVIALINNYFIKYRNTAIAIYASIPMLSNSLGAVVSGALIQAYGFQIFFTVFLLFVLPIFIPIYLLRHRFLYL